jgi:hypothetical protein
MTSQSWMQTGTGSTNSIMESNGCLNAGTGRCKAGEQRERLVASKLKES